MHKMFPDGHASREGYDLESAALMAKLAIDSHAEVESDSGDITHDVLFSLSSIRKRLDILLGLSISSVLMIIALFVFVQRRPAPAPAPYSTAQLFSSPTSTPLVAFPNWLIATMTPVQSITRRSIIRSTWQKHAASNPDIRCVCFIGQPTPDWNPMIQAENKTYGDLVTLSIEDTAYNANKAIEFFKHLRDTSPADSWKFVTKLDDDSYLSAADFYTRYLLPNMDKERLMIGRDMLGRDKGFQYPGEQMYTL